MNISLQDTQFHENQRIFWHFHQCTPTFAHQKSRHSIINTYPSCSCDNMLISYSLEVHDGTAVWLIVAFAIASSSFIYLICMYPRSHFLKTPKILTMKIVDYFQQSTTTPHHPHHCFGNPIT